jgi:hypothetical protein
MSLFGSSQGNQEGSSPPRPEVADRRGAQHWLLESFTSSRPLETNPCKVEGIWGDAAEEIEIDSAM